jgi:hypothetical protein
VALCHRRTQRKIYVPNSYDPHTGDVACTLLVEVQAHDGVDCMSLAPVAEAAWWVRLLIPALTGHGTVTGLSDPLVWRAVP